VSDKWGRVSRYNTN